MYSLLKPPNLEDIFHPATSLLSQDLLDPELKIKACRLIDTIWLVSMRLGHEVIKNNSSCHYPNNSVGLSDCNPIWPFVIRSAAITRLRFRDLWRANSPPNKHPGPHAHLWKSRVWWLCPVVSELRQCFWGALSLGMAEHLPPGDSPGVKKYRLITAIYQHLGKMYLCR